MVRLDKQDVMVLLLKPRIVLVLVDLGWNGQTGVLAREHVLEVYDPEDEPTTAIWHPRVKQKRVTLTQVHTDHGVHGALARSHVEEASRHTAERSGALVKLIRQVHPVTPILVSTMPGDNGQIAQPLAVLGQDQE